MSGSPLKKFSQKSFSISSAYLITLNLVTWPPLVKGGLRDAMFILGILPPLNNRDIPLIRSGECVMGRQISLTQQFHTEREREMGFPGGSDGKESACNAGDQDSIPGLG